MGTVSQTGNTVVQTTAGESTVILESTNEKENAGRIVAVPVEHKNAAAPDGKANENKYLFDHWELNGQKLEGVGAEIAPGELDIPYHGSELKAYFKINPEYYWPLEEKKGSSFEDMTQWLEDLQTRDVPLNPDGCQKTA